MCKYGGTKEKSQRRKNNECTKNENNKRSEKDSEIVIEFEGENVPKKVFLGFMSHLVRVYVPKPLRCFNCQRFGHTAKNCKQQRRCARYGGDHEYGKCGTGVQPKCCSCGGAHNVAYAGCEIMTRENTIQKEEWKERSPMQKL